MNSSDDMDGAGKAIDPKTGLPNSTGCEALLDLEARRSRRHDATHALLRLDAGPDPARALQLAAALTASVRMTDVTARVEDGAIGVLAYHCASPGAAAARLRADLGDLPFPVEIRFAPSAGTALLNVWSHLAATGLPSASKSQAGFRGRFWPNPVQSQN